MSINPGAVDPLRILVNYQDSKLSKVEIEAVTFLLADFLSTTSAYLHGKNSSDYANLQGAELAAYLAIASSNGDMDDVDWREVHHPGSVILPAVLAVGIERHSTSDQIQRAIQVGYRSAAIFSGIMSSEVRQKWHATSMAGAIGATHAVSELFGLTTNQAYAALSLTCANIGGLAQAGIERNGAAQFNRGAAASLSVISARAALMNTPHLPHSFTSLMLAWGIDPEIACIEAEAKSHQALGIQSASLRLLPVSGYMQAAVHAVVSVLMHSSAFSSPQISVAPSTYRLTVTGQSPYNWVDDYWWNLPLMVNHLLQGASAFSRRTPVPNSGTELSVEFFEDSSLAPNEACLQYRNSSGQMESHNFVAPGGLPLDETTRNLWDQKCSLWLGVSPERNLAAAQAIMSNGLQGKNLEELFST
jgi:hypothetical protein